MNEMFYFLLFYNALDLDNQKMLCLPSIYEFERTGTTLNHPKNSALDNSKNIIITCALKSDVLELKTLQYLFFSGSY